MLCRCSAKANGEHNPKRSRNKKAKKGQQGYHSLEIEILFLYSLTVRIKKVSALLCVLTRVGFEPTPMKTTALTLRLRPLGHRVVVGIAGLLLVLNYSTRTMM